MWQFFDPEGMFLCKYFERLHLVSKATPILRRWQRAWISHDKWLWAFFIVHCIPSDSLSF